MAKPVNIVRAIVATACFGFSVWALYLHAEALPPGLLWFPGHPGFATAGIAICLALVILLAPLNGPGGREVSGAPQATPGRTTPILGLIALALILASREYMSHAAIWGNERPIWIDHYAFILLPALLACATAWWLYDTVYGRILTGTATGKSPAGQRALLMIKRLAVAGLIAALMLQTVVPIFHIMPSPAYRDATSQAMLTAISALALSLVLIPRRAAFSRTTDGSAGTMV